MFPLLLLFCPFRRTLIWNGSKRYFLLLYILLLIRSLIRNGVTETKMLMYLILLILTLINGQRCLKMQDLGELFLLLSIMTDFVCGPASIRDIVLKIQAGETEKVMLLAN